MRANAVLSTDFVHNVTPSTQKIMELFKIKSTNMVGTCRLIVVVQASELHYRHLTSLFFGFQLWESKKFDTPLWIFLGIGSQSCRFLPKLDRPPHAQLQLLMYDWTMAMPGRGLATGHMDAAFTPYRAGSTAFTLLQIRAMITATVARSSDLRRIQEVWRQETHS